MVLYAFDVDQTLWLSGGPIKLADLMGQHVPADEYVMVGNIQGVSGESDDQGAASRAGWRFISETAFGLGAR